MKKWSKVLIIAACLVAVLVVAGFIAFSVIQNNLEALAGIKVEDIDTSALPDGVYAGSYSEFPVSAEVKVKLKGGAIEDITLVKHVSGKGQAAEAIPGMVIDAQSLDVDAISGATYSSKVILLAIKDALE